MSTIGQAAVSRLRAVLQGYLPDVSAASIDRDLLIVPKRIRPLGIGGYVGLHDDPAAEISGCSLEAEAEIRVSAQNSNLASINEEISGLTAALLSTNRTTLRRDGIFKLDLRSLTPPDSANHNARVATFEVRCEHLQLPTESGGTIDEIVLKNLLNPADRGARFIANISAGLLGGLPDPLADFHALTDPDVVNGSPAAAWSVNASEQRIEQGNNVQGGGLTLALPRKAGALLLCRPGGIPTRLRHVALGVDVSSDSPNGIGCVLRWRDTNNYYYFLISRAHGYQVFGKKVNGTWSFLDTGGQSGRGDIDLSSRQRLQVIALGSRFSAFLNERLICAGEDASLPDAGETGLLAHGNNAAYFHAIDLVELDH